jgi:hypothetical protein
MCIALTLSITAVAMSVNHDSEPSITSPSAPLTPHPFNMATPPNKSSLSTEKPRRRRFGFDNAPTLKDVVLYNWLDTFTQLCCLTSSILLIYFTKPIWTHYFPLPHYLSETDWTIRHGVPFRKECLDTFACAMISYFGPLLSIIAIGVFKLHSFWSMNAAVCLLLFLNEHNG